MNSESLHHTKGIIAFTSRLLTDESSFNVEGKRINKTDVNPEYSMLSARDEFDVAAVTSIEEAKKLIAIGFEYITEMKGIKLFRKPKRFNI